MKSNMSSIQPSYSPTMELLGGVLSQTSWIEENGPKELGNEYFRALQTFFERYRDCEAIQLCETFTRAGFTYDAPPAFICHLGPLPELKLTYDYSDYLLDRAGGRQNLENFRISLQKLVQKSDFISFYRYWEPYLKKALETSLEGFRSELITSWLEDFFGWRAEEFRLIMSPSMFNAYYGARVETSKTGFIAFQIIGEGGVSLERPQFPSGLALEEMTVHEFGHSFVNPSMEAFPDRAKKLYPLLEPIARKMQNQAYPSIMIFLNEQVLRAVEILAARDFFEEGVDKTLLVYHMEDGFYLTDYVVKQLELYRKKRDKYQTFRDFVPFIYDKLEQYQQDNSA